LVLRDSSLPDWAVSALDAFITLNLVLGIFNLLPIPPLDGGRIAVGLLPLPLARQWARLERFGIVFVLLLLAVPALLRQQGIDFDPLSQTLIPAVTWAYALLLQLAGVHYAV
jgi:Zn-dependent protease